MELTEEPPSTSSSLRTETDQGVQQSPSYFPLPSSSTTVTSPPASSRVLVWSHTNFRIGWIDNLGVWYTACRFHAVRMVCGRSARLGDIVPSLVWQGVHITEKANDISEFSFFNLTGSRYRWSESSDPFFQADLQAALASGDRIEISPGPANYSKSFSYHEYVIFSYLWSFSYIVSHHIFQVLSTRDWVFHELLT